MVRHPVSNAVRVTAVLVLCGGAGSVWAGHPEGDVRAGRETYVRSCAVCHGAEGAGDGPYARRFYPRPRDLTSGIYKFRSTVSGTAPTDEDLHRAIAHGLPGTNMPDWRILDEQAKWDIVAYLKTLSPVFGTIPPEPVILASDPGQARADLAQGREVYTKLGCASCHGEQGRANGPSASAFMDDWGMPIRPANLTQGWNYRGGGAPRDIVMRVLAGIDGSGMPSYTGAAEPEDVWQMAYYVASLQEPIEWNPIVRAVRLGGAPPAMPDDARWDGVPAVGVRLRNAVDSDGVWAQPATVNLVQVQTARTEEELLVRVVWDDPTEDRDPQAADRFAMLLRPHGVRGDQVSLQAWPYRGAPPLDVCAWRASDGRAREIVADRFDAVDASRVSAAPLTAQAAYEDGRWRLVLRRPLVQRGLEHAAVLGEEPFAPLAFAVWDGGNPGARAVSPWLDVRLEEPASGAAHAATH
ncbi:MAG TPA: c-type cytochrome [bacterium]